MNALLDSGAAAMFINKDIVDEYRWKTKPLKDPFQLINANGTYNKGEVKETTLINYYIKNTRTGERVYQQKRCYVAKIHDDMILEMDWLKKFNPQVDWERETLHFSEGKTNGEREPQIQRISHMAINTTMSHSQRLNQEHKEQEKTTPKTLEQLVPQYLLPYKEVFLQGKQLRKTIPIS
jgi:hypothetical protein